MGFISPELFSALETESQTLSDSMPSGLTQWDIATRYHDFKSKPQVMRNQKLKDQLKATSISAILEKSKNILGSLSRPMRYSVSDFVSIHPNAKNIDLDLEETLENFPLAFKQSSSSELYYSFEVKKENSIIIAVDTSLSMTGEKLALTAVALCLVLLQFPDDPIGMLAFENQVRVLKKPDEVITLTEFLGRFLDVPAQGYTHLELGMKEALKLSRNLKHPKPTTLLISDGKYTAGKDPAYLASRFKHLLVLKMGKDKSSLALCKELAQKGSGTLREIPNVEGLPEAMYSAIKSVLRQ